jgi:hypothetical protein
MRAAALAPAAGAAASSRQRWQRRAAAPTPTSTCCCARAIGAFAGVCARARVRASVAWCVCVAGGARRCGGLVAAVLPAPPPCQCDARRFHQAHGRYPGTIDGAVEEDAPLLRAAGQAVLADLGVSAGVALQDDLVGEMCRCAAARAAC